MIQQNEREACMHNLFVLFVRAFSLSRAMRVSLQRVNWQVFLQVDAEN